MEGGREGEGGRGREREGRGREFEAAAEIQKSQQQQQKRGGEEEGRRGRPLSTWQRSPTLLWPLPLSPPPPDSTSSSPSSAVKKGRERAFLFSLQASQRHSVTASQRHTATAVTALQHVGCLQLNVSFWLLNITSNNVYANFSRHYLCCAAITIPLG